jgi:glucans biosynthesis protein C
MATTVSGVNDESEASAPGRSARLHYLDWVRVLAILGVFVYHASRPFMLQEWLINDGQQSEVMSFVFLIVLGSFGMPLFFLVSGAAGYLALRRRSARQYVAERIRRLFIPFLAGCLLLSPIQFYLEWLHKGRYEGSFWSFLPILAEDRLRTAALRPGPTLFEEMGSHLWFLGFLLTFSLLALPLFLWLAGATGRRLMAAMGALGRRRGGVFLLAIPVIVARVLLQPRYPAYTDWADFVYMLLYFALGYILFADRRLAAAIEQEARTALALGLLCVAVMLGLLLFGPGRAWIEAPGSAGYSLGWAIVSFNGWNWTLVALWLGRRYLNGPSRWLAYGQQMIVPFFLFHQPVIVVAAYYVVEWPLPLALKWPIILLSSFVATVLLVDQGVRRVGPARALFGMQGSGSGPGAAPRPREERASEGEGATHP